jgi:diaminopimelate epimerase
MNATFIAVDSTGTEVRYNAGIRNRGAGTRADTPHNFRVDVPADRPFEGVSSIDFNTQYVESQVAGNAMRCVGKYLYESGLVRKENIVLETGGGLKSMQLYIREDTVHSVCVKMGQPNFRPAAVPVNLQGEVIRRKVSLAGGEWEITCLSMGNPHCVIFVPDVDQIELEKVGPAMEHDPIFPRRANISFAQVIDRNTLKMRVWERGIGETWACGTGASAHGPWRNRTCYCERRPDHGAPVTLRAV